MQYSTTSNCNKKKWCDFPGCAVGRGCVNGMTGWTAMQILWQVNSSQIQQVCHLCISLSKIHFRQCKEQKLLVNYKRLSFSLEQLLVAAGGIIFEEGAANNPPPVGWLVTSPTLTPSRLWAALPPGGVSFSWCCTAASPASPPPRRPIGLLLLSANRVTGLRTRFLIGQEENQEDNSEY